jgi:type I restriction enzyme S subunit
MSWRTMPLSQVARFVRGITFTPADVVPVGSKGTVACMRTKNVQSELDLSDVWGIKESFVKRTDQFLQSGDILVSSANSWNLVGKCCSVSELPWRATFGGFVSVLRPDPERVDARYLFRWFAADTTQVNVRSFGQQTTNISNLNIERCLGLPIPVPPLVEQRRIAEVLDRAEALRAKRRAALAQLDTLTQALFLDLFGDPATNPKGWEVGNLGDLAVVQGGLQVSASRKNNPIEVPYLRVANVYRNGLDLREVKTLRATPAEIARTTLVKDDLLIVEGHGNPAEIGRCALWDGSTDGCVHQNHLIRARLDRRRLQPLYACEYLNSAAGRQHLLRSGKTTSGLNTISVSDVRDTPIAVPALVVQQEFSRQVAVVEKVRNAFRSSLVHLDALFASLQHRAFRGEL